MPGGGGVRYHVGDATGRDDNGDSVPLPLSQNAGIAANSAAIVALVYIASGVPASGVTGHLFALNTADSGELYYNAGILDAAAIWVKLA